MVLKERPNEAKDRFYNLEKFILTRFLFDGTTKNYNQCCEKLLQVDDDRKYLLEYMSDSPVNNDTYKTRFRKFSNGQARLMLFLIEMLYRNGDEDKYSDGLRIDTFSLEHIMPQKWQTAWFDVAAYDENEVLIDRNDVETFLQGRNKAVKSLGNMTLLTTKLNTSVSNATFDIKMNGKSTGKNPGGIKKFASSLVTTKKIIDVFENTGLWDEREIYKHEEEYYSKLNAFYSFT